jgi:hypothetical protein
MAKEKGSNPMQDWRRKEKGKAVKAKKKAREERLSEISAHRRDPAPLISEIYRLSVLEYEGKLNSDMKQHKKRLFDQYQSIKKARTAAGLETVELVEFDPEAYENAKLQQKRQKLDSVEAVREKEVQKQQDVVHFDLDERGLPRLPEGPSPTKEELLALGLPAYSPFPYEAQEDEAEDCFHDLEAQLEAEYELFKESITE